MMQHNQDHQSSTRWAGKACGSQTMSQQQQQQQQAQEKEAAAEEEKQQESKGTDKRAKLWTSEDVDNHIKWDPALDTAKFTMCHQDRFGGLCEVPFDVFDHNSLAFHRVWVFKHQGTVVWDRENRIDHVF